MSNIVTIYAKTLLPCSHIACRHLLRAIWRNFQKDPNKKMQLRASNHDRGSDCDEFAAKSNLRLVDLVSSDVRIVSMPELLGVLAAVNFSIHTLIESRLLLAVKLEERCVGGNNFPLELRTCHRFSTVYQ
jgi:hypothetical protein